MAGNMAACRWAWYWRSSWELYSLILTQPAGGGGEGKERREKNWHSFLKPQSPPLGTHLLHQGHTSSSSPTAHQINWELSSKYMSLWGQAHSKHHTALLPLKKITRGLWRWLSRRSACYTGMRTWVWILSMHMRNCVLVGEVERGEWQGLMASRFSLFSKLHDSERLCPGKQGARHWRISTWSWPLPPFTCTHMYIHTCTHMHVAHTNSHYVCGAEGRNTRLWSWLCWSWGWFSSLVLGREERKKKQVCFWKSSLKRLL